MDDERQPWDRMEGEPSRWFQRFERYRLQGPGRTVLGTVNAERVTRGQKKSQYTPGSWRKAFDDWQWKVRATAWDQYLVDQANAEWEAQIMRGPELLARLSQMARNNINDFLVLGEDGHIANLDQDELAERGHLIRKISSSEGKTNSIAIEGYDAQGAMQMLGKNLRLFTNLEDQSAQGQTGPFALPADVIAPSFVNAYRDIRDHKHTEYLFYGGRGSTKSSFISLVIVYLLINNPTMHAVALRQVANTLRDSVYSQFLWAIAELGLEDKFKCTTSPLEIEYKPTGQKIYFRGADDPGKIKSIKPAFGYIAIAWFEELDQFHGEEAIRKIEQSVIRGGDLAYIFKSFNPPRTVANWANKYTKIPKATQYQHSSNYLDVPPEWLGKPWIEEAEHLKTVNPTAYEHEYLGVANGTGGMVFENVQIRAITDAEIYGAPDDYGLIVGGFDRILQGLDWGYYPDPFAWNKCHYDAGRHTLYIFDELRMYKAGNRETHDELVEKKGVKSTDLLIADSAEPKSIGDYRDYGLSCRGAEKGPESVKYSMKWLQSLAAIVIDNVRCPETAQEFLEYELEMDNEGNFISEYPDKNNHHIDATRYATNLIWRRRGQ